MRRRDESHLARKPLAWRPLVQTLVLFTLAFALYDLSKAIYVTQFTDRNQMDSIYQLQGRSREQVEAVLGEPMEVLAKNDPRYPLAGYGRPKIKSFSQASVYPLRYGIAYIYFDDTNECFWIQYAGG